MGAVLAELAPELADGTLVLLTSDHGNLEDQVQQRTIGPEALKGQTISLSNFGAVAGLHAEMVVVPPQVAQRRVVNPLVPLLAPTNQAPSGS